MNRETPAPCDLLIRDAVVLVDHQTVIADGAVAVSGTRIAAVGPSAEMQERYRAAETIAARGGILLPGLVNTHNHTPLMIVRGMAEDLGFAPAYTPGVPQGHWLSDEETLVLARLGAYELLRQGSTTVVDYYRRPQACAQAFADLGLRAFVGGRIHDADTAALANGAWRHDTAIGEATLRENVDLIETWDGAADGRVRCILAPHAADTCSRDLLALVARMAEGRGLPVHTHLSQSSDEVERVAARDGLRPPALFDELGLCGPKLVGAHCIHVDADEIGRLGRSGTVVAHAPLGNSASGFTAPAWALEQAGAAITLCTDTKSADMFEAMRGAIAVARIRGAGFAIRAADAFRWATANGAAALGMSGEVGAIRAGAKADLVLLDPHAPNLCPAVDGIGIVVHSASGANVDTVVVDGRVLLRDGRALHVDGDAIVRDAHKVAAGLWRRAGHAVPAFAERAA